jgi:dTDP-glucose 4,6-dehydratase/UDP-glucose 4-epimerase
MTRVLVIGSEGFIGSTVARVLSEDCHVQKADIVFGMEADNYHLLNAEHPDFVQLLETTKPDVVINCSGAASVPLSFEDPSRDFRLNTVRVVEMLEAIRTSAPSVRLVHLSSAAVYGNPLSLPVRENAVAAPVSPYGWHKFLAEQTCREYGSLFGVQSVSLRVFSCYGPGLRKQIFWDVFQKSRRSNKISLFGTGEEARDFIYVEDLALAIRSVIDRADFDGRVINAASGRMVTINDAVSTFLGHLGADYDVAFTGASRRGDPDRWVADISYLSSLGFHPRHDMKTGLERTAAWLIAQG